MTSRRWSGSGLALVAVAALVWLGAGCAGYRLGPNPGSPAGSRSIRIDVAANESRLPRAGEELTRALRKRVQQDGAYRLSTRGDADVRLVGTLVDLDRSTLSFQPDDLASPRDYLFKLTARVRLEGEGGRIVWEKSFTGKTTARFQEDQAAGERQALPLVCEDLARKIVDALVDGSW